MKKILAIPGWMCDVDFHHELGESSSSMVYASLEDLKENRTCIDECGVAEVVTMSKADFELLIARATVSLDEIQASTVGEIFWSNKNATLPE